MANSKWPTTPVQLAPVKGVGDVSWQTPIKKNCHGNPLKDKVTWLLSVNRRRHGKRVLTVITSILF